LEIFEELARGSKKQKGFKIVYEPPFLRHFTARFEEI
jgi:tryptophanase